MGQTLEYQGSTRVVYQLNHRYEQLFPTQQNGRFLTLEVNMVATRRRSDHQFSDWRRVPGFKMKVQIQAFTI